MTQEERAVYAGHEVFLFLIEALVAKMYEESMPKEEILEVQNNLWSSFD